MKRISVELQRQLESNINAHKKILDFSVEIKNIIKKIHKKLAKGGKILFVMVVLLQIRNILLQNSL